MKRDFVQLSNTTAFMDGYERVERRGAPENCFMVVDGKPGYGKSTTAHWFAVQNDLPFIRAKKNWRPTWMLRELLQTMQTTPGSSHEVLFQQIIQELGKRSAIARLAERPFAMIIDEADHIIGSSALIETLRDFTDLIEVPILLIGMGKIGAGIQRYPQVASRANGNFVEFKALTPADTRLLVEQCCEVEVDDDLVQVLHRHAEGYAREVMTGLAAIERVGRRLDRPVRISDMVGQLLLTQRSTGTDIILRG
jgi:hypothetical protein